MSAIDRLVAEGHRRLRLPHWNQTAHLEPDVLPDGTVGPWSTLRDGTTEQRIFTGMADAADGWEPVT